MVLGVLGCLFGHLVQGERLASADIPASDALVLALACDVPILVAERLLAGS